MLQLVLWKGVDCQLIELSVANSALSSLATRFWVTLHGGACFYWRECTLNWFIPTPFLMESCGIGLDKRISEWTFSLQPGRPSVVIEKEVWSFGIFLLMGHNLLLHLSAKFWAKPTVKLIVDLVDLELRWFNPIIKGMLLMEGNIIACNQRCQCAIMGAEA